MAPRNQSPLVQHTPEPAALDVVPPKRIAALVEDVGVKKAELDFLPTLALAVLAGAFISFGAMFFSVTITGSELGFGLTRVLGGLTFSLGLVLVIVGGAELFTGNSLIVMAWASRRIGAGALARNWAIVYLGNLIGALGTVALVQLSGVLQLGDGALGATAEAIAQAKVALDPQQAFVRGILCNVFVCLAVWMCFAAHTVSGKVLAIIFPDHRLRGAGLRAFHRQHVLHTHRRAADGEHHRRHPISGQPGARHPRQYRGRRRAGGARLLADLFARR